jgi:hypothetical protein
MPRLSLKRFVQDPGCCAIASSASIANFYNSSIDFDFAKEAVVKHKINRDPNEGLWSGEIGRLLNCLGFKKVTIISSNLDILCYSWAKLSKVDLIKKLEKVGKRAPTPDIRRDARCMAKFLTQEEYQNSLKIDREFCKHIRTSIDEGKPVIASFNWNMFFRQPKYNDREEIDPVKGDYTEHAICCVGYTKKGVWVVDSHHEYYTYSLKKYRKGRYHMQWEDLASCMGFGDLLIADNYDPDWVLK